MATKCEGCPILSILNRRNRLNDSTIAVESIVRVCGGTLCEPSIQEQVLQFKPSTRAVPFEIFVNIPPLLCQETIKPLRTN
jgi:hypothetical protein